MTTGDDPNRCLFVIPCSGAYSETAARARQSEGGWAKESSKDRKAREADERESALAADLERIQAEQSQMAADEAARARKAKRTGGNKPFYY